MNDASIKKITEKNQNELSDRQLVEFASKIGDSAKFSYLDDIIKKYPNLNHETYFVHTGEKPNENNGGHPGHWLLLHGDKLFDSYGKYKSYKGLNGLGLKHLHTVPSQLQAYNSSVCGEYCALMLKHLKENQEKYLENDYETAGEDFSHRYGMTNDKPSNDLKVLKHYKEM
jgi:hypothetical protein